MATNDAPIADLSKWAPPQRRRLVDGDVVVEKLAPAAGPRMLDPNGVVVERLPLTNGIANKVKGDPYANTILGEKLAAGWVHFDRCPLGVSESMQHVPDAIRCHAGADGSPDVGRPKGPCTRGADGGKITATNPCACVLALEKHRKTRHAKKEAAADERVNKLAKLAERTAQANLDATTQLAAAAQALAEAGRVAAKGKGDK